MNPWIEKYLPEFDGLQKALGKSPVPGNHAEAKKWQAVFDRLVAGGGLDHIPWDVRLVEAPRKRTWRCEYRVCALCMFGSISLGDTEMKHDRHKKF